jgi:hypothetical protein
MDQSSSTLALLQEAAVRATASKEVQTRLSLTGQRGGRDRPYARPDGSSPPAQELGGSDEGDGGDAGDRPGMEREGGVGSGGVTVGGRVYVVRVTLFQVSVGLDELISNLNPRQQTIEDHRP